MDKLHKLVDGVKVYLTEEEESLLRAEWNANEVEAALKEYAIKRESEYPPICNQLDMIYWDNINNTTIWKDTIAGIKAKYPKPEQS